MTDPTMSLAVESSKSSVKYDHGDDLNSSSTVDLELPLGNCCTALYAFAWFLVLD